MQIATERTPTGSAYDADAALREFQRRYDTATSTAQQSTLRAALSFAGESATWIGVLLPTPLQPLALARLSHRHHRNMEAVAQALALSDLQAKHLLLARLQGLDVGPVVLEAMKAIGKDVAIYVGGGMVVGAGVGAAAGAFVGGVGALPGGAAGALAGAELGFALLNLLGLGFLLVSGARSLGETGDCYLRGFAAAWAVAEIPEEHVAKRQQLMFQASERFAQGHLHLMLALLQGVVAYLMKGQAAKGLMYTKLGATKLRDFAGWVQKNEARLVTMPALQPQASKTVGELVQEQRMAGVATERAAPVARTPQAGPKKLKPGTAEHKADRWARYQADGGLWGYQRWSKQYDTNMRNYTYGLAREEVIRKSMGGVNQLRKTPFTYRQIDVFNQAERYMGQIKTGRVSLTKDNVTAIRKDAWFVQRGFRVEHILEAGATKPYLDALTRAGISYRLGPYRSGD